MKKPFELTFCVSNNGLLHVLTMFTELKVYTYTTYRSADDAVDVDNSSWRFLEYIGDMRGLENDLSRGGFKHVSKDKIPKTY